jgi:hypothetical protein
MSVVVDVASVIAATEIIKRLASRVGFEISGEVTIVVAALVGAVLSVAQGGEVLTGLFQGGAAVGSVTVASKLGNK